MRLFMSDREMVSELLQQTLSAVKRIIKALLKNEWVKTYIFDTYITTASWGAMATYGAGALAPDLRRG
jgi:hypothetical protein